jgi:hypothetical protein
MDGPGRSIILKEIKLTNTAQPHSQMDSTKGDLIEGESGTLVTRELETMLHLGMRGKLWCLIAQSVQY